MCIYLLHLLVSQTVHLSTALAGLSHIHVEHFHPPTACVGAFIPAADQSKPLWGAAGLEAGSEFGLAVSQTEHFSVALAGLSHMHVEHFQPPVACVGAFIPAADQSKPLLVGCTGTLFGVEKS